MNRSCEVLYKILGGVSKEYGSSSEWTSEAQTSFPCDLYLRLQHVAKVKEMRLLLHHAYIPNKIELLVSATPDVSKSSLQSLGVTYTEDSSSREFNSRELKSIQVSVTCRVICIRFHGYHENAWNPDGKVALCGIMILGDYERTPKLFTHSTNALPKLPTHCGEGQPPQVEMERRRGTRSGLGSMERVEGRHEEKPPREAKPLVKLPKALRHASTIRGGNQTKVVDGEDEYEEEISVPAISLDGVPQGKVQVIEGLGWRKVVDVRTDEQIPGSIFVTKETPDNE